MAPGVLLTDWPEVVWGGIRRGRIEGLQCAVVGLLLAHSCRLHSSQAALDPRLTATPIISQSDRVAGAACLSPVLNHSISAGGGGGGGGLKYLSPPKPTPATQSSAKTVWAQLIAAVFMQRNAGCKYSLCGLVANSQLVGRCECVCADTVYRELHHFTTRLRMGANTC